ncbi:MAG: hypothetical protein R3A12_19395 [Ignavibacteria bacterium]|nr:hypothetical protein [Ignavibacteriota bacterium]
MKKNILFTIFIVIGILVNSCSNDEDNPVQNNSNFSETPLANSQFDSSNFGIYKGVIAGSSGYVMVNVNNDNSISAKLVIDGIIYDFTSSQTIQQNQQTTIYFVSEGNSFTYRVSATGTNPTVSNIDISGHPNAAIILVKETSTTLVKCYEGTFSGDDTGIFNALFYGNMIKGQARNVKNEYFILNGTVTNNQISASGSASSGATYQGILNGNSFSGNWSNTVFNIQGTFSGNRTF